MNSYSLTKQWFSFCHGNNSITANHIALYFWLVECNNQQQWRKTFRFSFDAVESCIHISYKTFKKTLDSLVEWGFIEVINKPVNRFSPAWEVSLGKTTALNDSEGENTMLKEGSVEEISGLNECSVGISYGETAKLKGCSSGNSASCKEYNKTTIFLNYKNGRETHAHTREENLKKNSSLFFPEEEKKKSCAKKRKEEFSVREAAFKTAVEKYGETCSREILQDFFNHWSEPDAQGTMRFELEPTWELSRRLDKWMKREKQFNNQYMYGQTTKFQTKANGYAVEELDYSIPL